MDFDEFLKENEKKITKIDIPGPGKLGFWCQGACGQGVVCSDLTYTHGYCLDPEKRKAALKCR